MDAIQPTRRRSAAGTSTMALVVLILLCASAAVTACSGSTATATGSAGSPSSSSSLALSAASASPSPLPRGYTLSARETRAIASARRCSDRGLIPSGSSPKVTGYIIEFTEAGTTVGVYVHAESGEATPAGDAYGYVYYTPLWVSLPFERLWPASAGERSAMQAAHGAVGAWLADFPTRQGQFALDARHWIVVYEVTLTADDGSGMIRTLIDARGCYLGGVSP
jgi:hypothetical protein